MRDSDYFGGDLRGAGVSGGPRGGTGTGTMPDRHITVSANNLRFTRRAIPEGEASGTVCSPFDYTQLTSPVH